VIFHSYVKLPEGKSFNDKKISASKAASCWNVGSGRQSVRSPSPPKKSEEIPGKIRELGDKKTWLYNCEKQGERLLEPPFIGL